MAAMNSFSGTTLALMERFLDAAARRQTLIAQNLAQIDTPGYKAQDIAFEKYMHDLVGAAETLDTQPRAAARWAALPPSQDIPGLSVRMDQNNVDIDREMTAMSANVAKFSVVTQLLMQRLRLLRFDINDGR